jgi:hypothetical protein
MGGRPPDLNWRSGRKLAIETITSTEILEERLKELRETQRTNEQTVLYDLSSVLRCAGFSEAVAEEWVTMSIIYRVSVDSQLYYIQLHERFQARQYDDSAKCDFKNAKLEIEFHAANLRRIREAYSARLQVICKVYCYLREQVRVSFNSHKLTEKRAKLHYAELREQARILSELQSQLKDMKKAKPITDHGSGDNNGKKKNVCWKCQQSGAHTGGRENCPWKDLSNEAARAKGAEYVANKHGSVQASLPKAN